MLIACRDCAAIQRMCEPARGTVVECHRCGRVLENANGRNLDYALGCAITTSVLLLAANSARVMTMHVAGIERSTHLASGLLTAWRQGWPLITILLGLFAVVLPLIRFPLLSITLAALRLGARGRWLGPAFRLSEALDPWAMSDVLLIGAGIGYGRIVSQVSVRIDWGGWCFVAAAVFTMLTRATLERGAVWRRIGAPAQDAPAGAIACTSCDLVLPAHAEGGRCPRCSALLLRRKPAALMRAWALLMATLIVTPIAYAYPMSGFWRAGHEMTNTVISGILRLFQAGFWYFGVMITLVSVVFPLTKLIGLTWFLTSIRRGSGRWLRRKTRLYRFIDEVGRWSTLDPFTVMIFTPMAQFGQLAHFDFLVGTEAFLATVVFSMLALHLFDPRLMWDAARKEGQGLYPWTPPKLAPDGDPGAEPLESIT